MSTWNDCEAQKERIRHTCKYLFIISYIAFVWKTQFTMSVSVDDSPRALYDSRFLLRLRHFVPNARIIITLRNPTAKWVSWGVKSFQLNGVWLIYHWIDCGVSANGGHKAAISFIWNANLHTSSNMTQYDDFVICFDDTSLLYYVLVSLALNMRCYIIST